MGHKHNMDSAHATRAHASITRRQLCTASYFLPLENWTIGSTATSIRPRCIGSVSGSVLNTLQPCFHSTVLQSGLTCVPINSPITLSEAITRADINKMMTLCIQISSLTPALSQTVGSSSATTICGTPPRIEKLSDALGKLPNSKVARGAVSGWLVEMHTAITAGGWQVDHELPIDVTSVKALGQLTDREQYC